MLAAIGALTASMAWLCSQIEPAWATRYLAVVLGPLLLALASVVSRSARWTALALVGVAAVWLISGPPAVKTNVRTVSTGVAPSIRPGDLVVSTQPEQVPALYRYLPAGVVYRTPMGLVSDPRQTDWRDGLARLRAGTRRRELLPAIGAARPRAARVLIVTPGAGQAALAGAVGARRADRARASGGPRWRPRRGCGGSAASTTIPLRKNTVRRGALRGPLANPDVQVVVVVDQRHDDVPRALEVQPRADEDLHRAGRDEAVDEVLRELAIDL